MRSCGGRFAFDDEARLGVLEQQKRCGARHQIVRHRGGGFLCACGQVQFDEAVQALGAGHQGAELGRTRQVVLDPMACGTLSGGAVLEFRLDHQWIGAAVGVGQGEPPSDEPLVEEPDAPRVSAGRRGSGHRLDRRGAGGAKQPLEHGQIEVLVFQGEGQLACQGRGRDVARRIDPPAGFRQKPMPLTGGAQRTRQWHAQIVGVDKCRIAGRSGSYR